MLPKDTIRRFRSAYAVLTSVLAVALCLCGTEATSRAAQTGPLVTQSEGPAVTAPPVAGDSAATGSPSLDQGYAAREASAKSLENFKGGDVVIVGGAGLVVILLLILILVSL